VGILLLFKFWNEICGASREMNTLLETWVMRLIGKRYLPVWLILIFDLTIVAASFLFALLLLTNFSFYKIYSHQRLVVWSLLELCYGFSFILFGSYQSAFRHTGVRDLTRLFYASIVAQILTFSITRFMAYYGYFDVNNLNIAFLILQGFSFIMGVLGIRLIVKLAYGRYILHSTAKNHVGLLIYGASTTGVVVCNAVKQDRNSGLEVVGFIDDNPKLVGKRIDGIKIYSFEEAFSLHFLRKNKIHEVIWSIKNEIGTSFHKVGDACLGYNLTFHKVPNVHEWIDGSLSRNQLKRVKIEDLLNRTAINLENPSLHDFIRGRRVLVTGAAGSIGSELCRQILYYGPSKLIMFDNAETPLNDCLLELKRHPKNNQDIVLGVIGDVTRENRVHEIFDRFKPELVFHAAAYKHVPMMEINAKEAVRVNVEGTRLVAEMSVKTGVSKFVMISTDKAVNPTNVMGATKRAAEILVQNISGKSKTEFITTRFGNVLGSNGSVIPLFKKQIELREDLTVTHKDIMRYFMTIPESCQLVFQATTMGKGGEIFVFDMGEPVKIYDLAEKMIKLSGLTLNRDIKIVETGLRPGEKLYEELLSNAENTLPTHHPKILIAKVRQYQEDEILPVFSKLGYAALNGATDKDLVVLLKGLIPEYKSQNSIYSELD
jgi:FlaA1/EpsC-like NDP-sugar epimerase